MVAVGREDPETSMFLTPGGADQIVRPILNEVFVRKMKAAGIAVQYLKIDGVGYAVAYAENFDITDPAIEKFLTEHFKPKTLPTQSQVNPKSNDVVIEDGGTGLYQALVTEDRTLPGMTIFRPGDLTPFGNEGALYRIEIQRRCVFGHGKTGFFC